MSSSGGSGSRRRYFVGGNWKSNGTRKSVEELVTKLNGAPSYPSDVDVVVAPVAIHLDYVQRTLNLSKYAISSQNVSAFGLGAYTGEIAAEQLKDFGIHWTLIGHSERRQHFGSTDEVVAKKVGRAQSVGLGVIACIGETLTERKADRTLNVVYEQLKALSAAVKDWSSIVIAYEPVWAIGTGLNATPAQAQEVHHAIRHWLAQNAGSAVAESIRIIYGGSVKGSNAADLIVQKDVDGFLVGGASLIADDFITIVNSISKAGPKL